MGFLVSKAHRGEVKVAEDGIESGFLKDGENLKNNASVFEVGEKGKPSLAGFEDFVLKLSNYLDKEIGGYFLSNKGEESINLVYVSAYEGNTDTKSNRPFDLFRIRPDLVGRVDAKVDYHTHLSRFADADRLTASGARGEGGGDMQRKADLNNSAIRYIIITNPKPYEHDY